MKPIRRLASIGALLLLAALLAGVPILLTWLTLPVLPQLPHTGTRIMDVLLARDDGTLIMGIALIVAWIAWAWLAVALLIEIVAALRQVPAPHLPALPQGIAKQLVAAALAVFVSVPAVTAAADTTTPTDPAPVTHSSTTGTQPAPTDTTPKAVAASQHKVTQHTITSSDTLIGLARTYLGDGDRYLEIFEENRGIVQANGSRLTDPDLIVDGTVLTITLDELDDTTDLDDTSSATTPIHHTVTVGDTLIGLARTYLGDGDRYLEIFEENRGIVQANGSRLTDPDLIVDGTVLTITLDTEPSTPPDATTTTPDAEATTHTDTTPAAAEDPPSTPTTQAPTTSPTPVTTTAPATASTDDATPAPEAWPADDEPGYGARTSFGVGAVLAAGVVSLIGTRRFWQSRTRARGAQLAMPDLPAAQIEHELRAVSDPIAIDDVDLALRSLAAHCRATDTRLPEIRIARLTGDTFEIYTAEPAELPAPWTGTAAGMLWSWQNDEPLDREALAELPAPYPALVCIGQDIENAQILLDLEAIGEFHIAGDQATAKEILTAMALELATSQWADDLTVTLVGAHPEMEDALHTDRIRYVPTPSRLLEELTRRTTTERATLTHDHLTDSHHARQAGIAASTWFPEIVLLAHPLTDTQTAQLDQILTELPRVAVAAVAINDDDTTEWALRLGANGTDLAVLEPPGLAVAPQHITGEAYRRVLEIIDVTAHGQEIANQATPSVVDSMVAEAAAYLTGFVPQGQLSIEDENIPETVGAPEAAGEETAEVEPVAPTKDRDEPRHPSGATARGGSLGPVAGTPYLRVLGPVELVGAEGPSEPNRTARLVEYLAYLMLTPGPVTSRGIDDAIWPNRTKENNATTRDPVTSRLRKWLSTTPTGDPRIDMLTFTVHDVDCDWVQFEGLTAGRLADLPGEQMTAALSLVRGLPFKGVPVRYYGWAEPIRRTMITRIIDVVYEVAIRHLVDERWSAAEEALAIGIDIEPGDEQLWRMRILAAHARHNRPALEEATSRLFAQLEALETDPEPETTAFLSALNEGASAIDLLEMI